MNCPYCKLPVNMFCNTNIKEHFFAGTINVNSISIKFDKDEIILYKIFGKYEARISYSGKEKELIKIDLDMYENLITCKSIKEVEKKLSKFVTFS